MLNSQFITQALGDNPSAMAVKAESILLDQVGDKTVVPCRNLDLDECSRLGHCEFEPLDEPRPCNFRYWGGRLAREMA